MVRVVSVHNFVKQEITSVDEPIAVARVPPDILLLAQPNNTILVRDLLLINDPGYTIPTVDQIVKILYSIQGNYIASLESKVTRNGTKVSYTRVYINWESLKDKKETFPMRARIAGRVTPLSQSQKGLEMIEIPNQSMPENISCCPVSGNLLVSSKNILNIYLFVTQTHDISKIHFIDFKALSFDLHITFKPTRHQIVEDIIAAQNDEFIHIFRISSVVLPCSQTKKELSPDDEEKVSQKIQINTPQYKTINYEKLLEELKVMKSQCSGDSAEEMQKMLSKLNGSGQSELAKLNPLSFPIRHDLPTVLLERSLPELRNHEMFRQNSFLPAKELIVDFISNSTFASNPKNQYKATNLCQYHLIPLSIGSNSNQNEEEKFTFLILRPYYSSEKTLKKSKHHLLESEHFANLKTVACFFGTQQEGYLQCFEYDSTEIEDSIICTDYQTYAFTAPVFQVELDDCFLHAITEVGLETYTLRAAKHLLKIADTEVCPSSNDPVCLIGLNPFVNVFCMCLTARFLTLFAASEESFCTLYQLETPDISGIWKDFLASADENKWEAPSTYCEMLGEGHLILKTKLNTIEWISKKDPCRNLLSYADESLPKSEERQSIKSAYDESCALLGDYHILNRNHQFAYCYYTMSGFRISEISKRIRSLWQNVPEVHRGNYSESDIMKGLIYFLKKTLSLYDKKYHEFSGNREEFYNPEIGNLVNILMDLLEAEDNSSISDLVLDSAVLREFSTDRILKTLKSILSRSSVPQDKDALSLALMCIQRDQSEQAKTVLLMMTAEQLEPLLLQYYKLLFDARNSGGINMFTELSLIMIEIYPKILAKVLSDLIREKTLLSLSKVLKIFTSIIPTRSSRLKNSSEVFRIILENYFKYYEENFDLKKFDRKWTEAMKILLRIYLSRLQQQQQTQHPNGNGSEMTENDKEENSSSETILFRKFRPNYLNKIPPVCHDLKQLFLPEEEDSGKDFAREKDILLKIQCILSFPNLPRECVLEVRNFLANQTNFYGRVSLQILTAENVQEAVKLLIEFAPQPLGQFSKDKIKEKDDWKFLVSRLLKKIEESKSDERLEFLYRQVLSEILHYIAENLNMEEVVDIIPEDFEEANRYFALAQNNAQANHLKTLIMITGKQLLASL